MAAVRRAKNEHDDYPEVVLVCLTGPQDAEEFFATRWPEAQVICDPDKKLYQQFGMVRVSVFRLLGPSAWWSGLRALMAGHGMGSPKGDPMQMSGALVTRDQKIIWRHVYRHAGDHPEFGTVQDQV